LTAARYKLGTNDYLGTIKASQDSTFLLPGNREGTAISKSSVKEQKRALALDCPRISALLSSIGSKWTVLVVMLLRDGALRFSELKREIGGISQRMLTLTLRGLERDGLVVRTVYPTMPPRVDYELTQLGHELRGPIEALGEWALAHLDVVDRARLEFDARAEASSAASPVGVRQIIKHR
jgi:DNA-binding HxlR family transcriptional regulator